MEAGHAVSVIESLILIFQGVLMGEFSMSDFVTGAGFGYEEGFDEGFETASDISEEDYADLEERYVDMESRCTEMEDLVDFSSAAGRGEFVHEGIRFGTEETLRKKPFESFVDQYIQDLNSGLR